MKWWDKLIEHFNRGYEEEDLELEWESSSIENWDWDTLVKDRNLLKMKDGSLVLTQLACLCIIRPQSHCEHHENVPIV